MKIDWFNLLGMIGVIAWVPLCVVGAWLPADVRPHAEAITAPKTNRCLEAGCYLVRAEDKKGGTPVVVEQRGAVWLIRYNDGKAAIGRDDAGSMYIGGRWGLMHLEKDADGKKWDGTWWDGEDEHRETWTRLEEVKP